MSMMVNPKQQENNMIIYKTGERVKHPKAEEWGLGEVLGSSDGENIDFFFEGAGKKSLRKTVQLKKVRGTEAISILLDNLKKTTGKSKFISISQATQFFLQLFPEGFYGEKFNKAEREYKVIAHNLSIELLNKEIFLALLQKEDYQQIVQRALKVVNKTNLIFPNEKMSLKDGLIKSDAQETFAKTLYELLFGETELQTRFEAFAVTLEKIDSAKWTIISYFLFIHFPEQYIFIKPTVIQQVAELCRFEINYKSELNWLTYNSVLKFADYLKTEISKLKSRDMIDVQSFMWCIEKYE